MFKIAVILSVFASVAAFMAPVNRMASKNMMRMEFANGLPGSIAPFPEFDPFQLSAGASADTLAWYRAAELKHGRICMLASLGLFVQHFGGHLPGSAFASTEGYQAASLFFAERPAGVYQILIAIAAIETYYLFKSGPVPDIGFDPLNYKSKYPDQVLMQTKELQNGRLAMLGASGLLLQEYVTGHLF